MRDLPDQEFPHPTSTFFSAKGVSCMRLSSPFAHKLVRMGIPGLFLLLFLTACGPGGSTGSTATSSATPATGGSQSTPTSSASAGQVTEFAGTSTSDPEGITTGPDGNLWFTEGQGD